MGFKIEQIALCDQPVAPGIAAQPSAGYYPVAGDDYRDRILSIGLPNAARGAAGAGGNFSIGAGGTEGNQAQLAPDVAAIGSAGRGERKIEILAGAIEILMQLIARTQQHLCVRLHLNPAPIQGDNRPILLGYGQIAQRRVQRQLRQVGSLRTLPRCGVNGTLPRARSQAGEVLP